MKKFLLALLGALLLVGCTKTNNTTVEKTSEPVSAEKINVAVTTSFLEDMVNVLAKDIVNTVLIIPAGEDPHTYEPKPEDYQKLSDAKLILYHGLHFEGKMDDVLESQNSYSVTKDFSEKDLLVMEEDGVKITDPHFWFDIELYKMAVKNAANALIEHVPDSKDTIEKNLNEYIVKLDELKEYGIKKISEIEKSSRILITPHDAFGYFSRQYDIEVKAPQGVSTDSELSTNEMAETATFIVDNKVKAIFAETTTDPSRMEKLKESCKEKGFDVEVVSGEGKELFSDSLGVKGSNEDNYLSMVKHNIDLIHEYLK